MSNLSEPADRARGRSPRLRQLIKSGAFTPYTRPARAERDSEPTALDGKPSDSPGAIGRKDILGAAASGVLNSRPSAYRLDPGEAPEWREDGQRRTVLAPDRLWEYLVDRLLQVADARENGNRDETPFGLIPPDIAHGIAGARYRYESRRAVATWEAEKQRGAEVASHPHVEIPPTSHGSITGLYVPPDWPRPLPGRDRYPEGQHEAQEGSALIVERPQQSASSAIKSEEIVMIDADFGVELMPGTGMSVFRDEEPHHRRKILDPTGTPSLEDWADSWLTEAGSVNWEGQSFDGLSFTQTGEVPSDTTRGGNASDIDQCRRRAVRHAHDLGTSLGELQLQYRTPGKRDPLLEKRRAVAITLRLEGFSGSEVAIILRRARSKVKPWLLGIEPLSRCPEIHDNWDRPILDKWRKSNRAWGRELSGIKRAIERGRSYGSMSTDAVAAKVSPRPTAWQKARQTTKALEIAMGPVLPLDIMSRGSEASALTLTEGHRATGSASHAC